MTTVNTKTPFRKTGIDKPTPDNLVRVTAQIIQAVVELQAVIGPDSLRAVRVEDLTNIGVVLDSPNGLVYPVRTPVV